jgi:glycosyltransferase involved in cell wall biosynthesis
MTQAVRRPRIAILWQGLSGYAHASFSALRDLGVDVLVFHQALDTDAPFDGGSITAGLRTFAWAGAPDAHRLESELTAFVPDALLVSSWHIPAYRRAARRRRGETLRVLCMDNQWWATPKQRLGVGSSRLLIRPVYDAAFLPSERSADFARRLGFTEERIIRGIYSCDHPRFDAIAEARGADVPERSFTFVGRLVREKGIDVLADGYRLYRQMVAEPWPLLVSGVGPQGGLLAGTPGVEMAGFVQPDSVPGLFARSGCLVLPSRFEPWAVVIHEATAAGLPVVCTSVCGAASRLVLDGYNGVVVAPGNATELARALMRIAGSTDAERLAMTTASRSLARQFTPARWASHLLRRVHELRHLSGLPAAPSAVADRDPLAGAFQTLPDQRAHGASMPRDTR